MSVVATQRSKKNKPLALSEEAMQERCGPPQQPEPKVLEHIDLSLIQEDKLNPRKKEEGDDAAIESLMKALQSVGQLQPIRVYEENGNFLLGYGHRRLEAARRLGWASIRAEVFPMPADRGEIAIASGIENIERANLTVFEEAVMVSQVIAALRTKELDDAEGGGPDMAELAKDLQDDAIHRAAEKLGRSPTWVRDRGYLARLDESVQKDVLEGNLPLGHARELAKLADKGLQKEGASIWGGSTDGRGHGPLGQLKNWVEQQMRSLRGVPWNLDIEFANKPACMSCPFNTANDKNLFEHDKKPPEDGLCLNDGCFNAKQRACEGAVKKAVAKMEDKKLEATATSAKTVIPGFLKPARVVREVKRGRGDLPKPKPRESSGGGGGYYESPQQKALSRFDDAARKWKTATDKLFKQAVVERPMRLIALYLASETKWGQGLYNADRKTIAKGKFILDQVKAADQEAIKNLLDEVLPYFEKAEYAQIPIVDECSTLLMKSIADSWGLQLEPVPDKATFIKEAAAKEKTAAAKAEKKPKDKGKKKSKRGGAEQETPDDMDVEQGADETLDE